MLLTLAAFAVALGILIVIHELGHYWVARLCGVRVLRFSVGFGRVLFQRTDRHGTEWALSAIPLGGYVKMLDEREASVPEQDRAYTFNAQSVWRRIAIVAAGPIANLLLASLLYAVLFMHGVRQPEPNQGPPRPVINAVIAGEAGAEAGLLAGDVVVAVGSAQNPEPGALVEAIAASPDASLVLTVLRNGAAQQVAVVPRAHDDGSRTIGRLGIQIGTDTRFETVSLGPIDSLVKGVERTGEVAWFSLRMLGNMVIGEASWRNLSGPITIADYAGQTARMGLEAYISFLALVSVSLGVLNLLPIPMLDGGHLLYYLVEIVRGAPPSERWLELGQRIGLALLLMLMGVALLNDIVRVLG